MAANIFLSVEVKAAENQLDCQTILLHPEVFALLEASVGDYLRMNLPDGSCFIAQAEAVCFTPQNCPSKSGKRLVYSTVCISCVAANCVPGRRMPTAPFMLELSNVTVLERVPIESLTVKVWLKTVSAVLTYRQNKPSFIKTLQNILSMYGIVSNCFINLNANKLAGIFGITSIQVGNVRTCCLETDTLTDRKLDSACPYVGRQFVCSNADCKLNIESEKTCRVFDSCEICYENHDELPTIEPAACNVNKSSSNFEASSSLSRPINLTSPASISNAVSNSIQGLSDSSSTNYSTLDVLPQPGNSSSMNVHQIQPSIHDSPNRTPSPATKFFPLTRIASHQHVSYGSVTVCHIESLQQQQQEQQAVPVGGMDEAKELLLPALLSASEHDRKKSGNSALLVGPPGCGKTTLVRHIRAATASRLVTVCCRSLATLGSQGTAAKGFTEAQMLSQERPCILFLPGIDHLAALLLPTKLKKDRWGQAQVWDSISSCRDSGCFVVASTSDSARVPPSLRAVFGIELVVGSSTLPYRTEVLRVLVAGRHWAGLDHLKVAKLTPGYVGADLKQLLERVEALLGKQHKLPSKVKAEELTDLVVGEIAHFTPHLVKTNPLLGERPEAVPLGGMEHLMAELQQILSQMISSGRFFAKLLLNVPRGVLLYGPPGCGKTQLICAQAASRGCTFFLVQPKHIVSPYVGETEQNLQAVFQAARTCRPSVVFFDEIDGLFGDRSAGQVSEVRQNLILEMLQILDGANAEDSRHCMDGILVCGATNNPDKLDAALLRPGRFDRLVYVPPPDTAQRLQILKVKCSGAELESEEVLEEIASKTDLLTGADLEAIIREAMDDALLSQSVTTDGRVRLTTALLTMYAAKTKPTVTENMLRRYQAFEGR